MGSGALMPLGMALAGPATVLFGEREFLVGTIVFHLIFCVLVLMVPGVKDFKMPHGKANYSEGEQPHP